MTKLFKNKCKLIPTYSLNSLGVILLIFSAVYFLLINQFNIQTLFSYMIELALLSFSILFINKFQLIHPCVLFLIYYLYSVALGPIVLMAKDIYYTSYNYHEIILGSLLCFALGNYFFSCLGRSTRSYIFKKKILNISRNKFLIYLLFIAYFAAIFYLIKNLSELVGNIESGRITAMSGNGALSYLTTLPIIACPMLFEIYLDTKQIKKNRLIFHIIISSFVLLVVGSRANIATMYLMLFLIYICKRKCNLKKVILFGFVLVVGVVLLGMIRSMLSGESTTSVFNSLLTSLYVGNINLNYVFSTFPEKVDFQYGYTYLINIIMLKPGPDLDFTLWLKEQVGISYSGGGLTPTILGEFYINWGESAIFIGTFAYAGVGVLISQMVHKNKESKFLALYLAWQFAHSCSGGIANVIIPVVIFAIIFKLAINCPLNNSKIKSVK